MDAYLIAKLVHICGAICWAGGGATLMVMTALAKRESGPALLSALRVQRDVGDRWFVPSSLLTFVSGIVLAWLGSWWSEAWVVLGLVGYLITAAIGPLLLKPGIRRALAAEEQGLRQHAEQAGHRYIQASQFDHAILFIIVALMVFKPTWHDTILLTLAGVVAAASVLAFLLPATRGGSSPG